jgi:hypothetical protein
MRMFAGPRREYVDGCGFAWCSRSDRIDASQLSAFRRPASLIGSPVLLILVVARAPFAREVDLRQGRPRDAEHDGHKDKRRHPQPHLQRDCRSTSPAAASD